MKGRRRNQDHLGVAWLLRMSKHEYPAFGWVWCAPDLRVDRGLLELEGGDLFRWTPLEDGGAGWELARKRN